MSYVGNENFWYGNTNVAFSENVIKKPEEKQIHDNYNEERYAIDCSTFVMLCLRGVYYENSRYYLGGEDNLITSGYIFDKDTEYYPGRLYGGGGLLANGIAKYAYEHGFLYNVNLDGSNIQAGDIIFTLNSDNPSFWQKISHCAIVADVLPNSCICVYEANADALQNYPIRNNYVMLNNTDPERGRLLAARFPLPFLTSDNIDYALENTFPISKTSTETGASICEILKGRIEENKIYTVAIEADFKDNISSYLGVAVTNSDNINGNRKLIQSMHAVYGKEKNDSNLFTSRANSIDWKNLVLFHFFYNPSVLGWSSSDKTNYNKLTILALYNSTAQGFIMTPSNFTIKNIYFYKGYVSSSNITLKNINFKLNSFKNSILKDCDALPKVNVKTGEVDSEKVFEYFNSMPEQSQKTIILRTIDNHTDFPAGVFFCDIKKYLKNYGIIECKKYGDEDSDGDVLYKYQVFGTRTKIWKYNFYSKLSPTLIKTIEHS